MRKAQKTLRAEEEISPTFHLLKIQFMKNRRENMAMKYRERISEFITTINTDKSYKMNDELLDVLKNNPNNIKRVIDNSSMRSTFKTEKERILANLANNSIYDS